MMKRFRKIFILLLSAAFLGGILTGIRELYLFLFIGGFVLLFGMGVDFWTAFAFSYTQTLERPEAVKGETVRLRLEIVNDLVYPFAMMRVQVDAVTERENTVLTVSLPPKGRASFELPLSCSYRGEHPVGMRLLEITDMFGLFQLPFPMLRLPYYRQRLLLVYPRANPLPDSRVRAWDAKSYNGSQFRPALSGDDYAGVREYAPGDRKSRVHWKLSAARGTLYVRRYEQPAPEQVILLLNDRSDFPAGTEAFHAETDFLCECAATIARHHLSYSRQVTVYSAQPERKPVQGSSPAGYFAVSRWLALLPFDSRAGAGERLLSIYREWRRTGSGTPHMYLITAALKEEDSQSLLDAATAGCGITCLLRSLDGDFTALRSAGIRIPDPRSEGAV